MKKEDGRFLALSHLLGTLLLGSGQGVGESHVEVLRGFRGRGHPRSDRKNSRCRARMLKRSMGKVSIAITPVPRVCTLIPTGCMLPAILPFAATCERSVARVRKFRNRRSTRADLFAEADWSSTRGHGAVGDGELATPVPYV